MQRENLEDMRYVLALKAGLQAKREEGQGEGENEGTKRGGCRLQVSGKNPGKWFRV